MQRLLFLLLIVLMACSDSPNETESSAVLEEQIESKDPRKPIPCDLENFKTPKDYEHIKYNIT